MFVCGLTTQDTKQLQLQLYNYVALLTVAAIVIEHPATSWIGHTMMMTD
jgi:hypothetical protein